MKKIVAFVGSPRKNGNGSRIVKEVLKGAKEQGAEVKLYHLNDMNIRGCQACFYCRKHDNCCIEDDMVQVYEDIKDADSLIFSSPIYIYQISGQLKILWDRLYPLTDEKHKPRFGEKKSVMIYTQAAPFEIFFKKYYRYNSKILKPMGIKFAKTLIATKAFELNSIDQNHKIMKKAYNAGKDLALSK